MSLEAQSINIPLTGGINDAIDEYLTQPGQALVMTNVRNNETGGAKKRYGTSVVTTTSTSSSGATLGSTIRLGTWRGGVVLTDDVYMWQLNTSGWSPSTTKLALPRIDHFGVGVGMQASMPAFDMLYDSATSSFLVVWQMDVAGGALADIYAGVFDATTGAIKWGVQRVTTTTGSRQPRLCKVGTYYALTWVDSVTGIVYVASKQSILSDFGAGTDITGGVLCISPYAMDACVIDGATNELAVVYGKAVGATPMRAVKVTLSGTTTVTVTSSLNLIDGVAVTIQGIGVQATSGEFLWIAYGLLDGGVPSGYFRALAVNHGAWTAAFATTNIVGATANLNLTRFAVERIDATHAFMVGSGGVLGTTPATSLFGGTISSVAVVTTNAMPGRFTLASRIKKRSNNTMIAWLTYCPYSALEPGSSILCELPYSTGANTFEQPRPIGAGPMRLVDVSSTGYERGSRVANIEMMTSNTKYATSVPMLRDLAGTAVSPQVVTADFADVCRNRGVQYGDAYYVSPFQLYDGERLSEVGFLTPPEIDSVTAGAGGNLSAGTYSVKTVYKWIDSRGRVIRSASSTAKTAIAAALDQVVVIGQILSVSDKQEDDTAVTTAQIRYVAIEVYRTEANGTIYYLDQTVTNFKTQTGNTGRFSVTLTQSDAALSANSALVEPLARNVAPPSLRSLVVWQNRLCGIGPDGRTIWISSAPPDTEQPSWNEAYNVYITDAVQLTAIAVLDEKLIAFSEHRMWVIAGNAADVNGNNGNLVPQAISSDVGASDDRSVVSFSGGVMFKAPDNFYLLDRGLSVQPVGLSVQSYTSAYPVCTSAVLVDRDNELRFSLLADETIGTGKTLVYHVTQNEWSVRSYTNAGGDAGIGFCTATCADSVWYASQNGTSTNLKETTASFLDAGTQFVSIGVETPWIKMADVQGFTRCKRIQFLYRPKTAAKVYCEIYADGESSTFYTHTYSEAETAVGRVVVHVPRQKVEMMKVRWTDLTPVTVGTGQGIEPVAMRLLVGIKKGVGKLLPATQKA